MQELEAFCAEYQELGIAEKLHVWLRIRAVAVENIERISQRSRGLRTELRELSENISKMR